MARLQGQNFRVGTLTGTTFTVYGMASSCSITRGTQTDDSSTKDDVGLASKPEITSKNTQVQVDVLDVTDMGAFLTAISSLQPLTIMWDETAASNNQDVMKALFSRKLTVYLSDATFNFNDRENAAKSIQFTGSGAPTEVTGNITTTAISGRSYTKGQYVRLFLGNDNSATPAKVIAAAKQLAFHVSVSLENATTKDTDGDYELQEPTGISYDITTNALVRSGDTITSSVSAQDFASIETIYEAGTPVKFQIANVSGANQRTKGAVIVSGSVIISQLQVNAPNRQSVDYTATLNGYGAYTVGA